MYHYGGHERQAGSDRQSAAQQRARVDHEVEHDAEEIEPAHGPAVDRDRFDAELLHPGRLPIALPQRDLDLVCWPHTRLIRVASNVLFDPDRLVRGCIQQAIGVFDNRYSATLGLDVRQRAPRISIGNPGTFELAPCLAYIRAVALARPGFVGRVEALIPDRGFTP